MRISSHRKIEEVRQSIITAVCRNSRRTHKTAQDLGDFQVNEVRGMQGLIRRKDQPANPASCFRLQEDFQDRRSVNDDQRRLFLSARMAAAGETWSCTGRRLKSRFCISARVGRSRA